MKNTIFNKDKVNELTQTLFDASDEIYRDLKGIDELLNLLMENYNDIFSRKICEKIKNNEIPVLKDYTSRLLNMRQFLIKMQSAYEYIDNDLL